MLFLYISFLLIIKSDIIKLGDRMKKIFMIICILFLAGCNKEEYFTCTIDLYNETQQYKLKAFYKIYHEDSFVTKIEKEERYISFNKNTLNYFNEYKNLEYSNLNNLYGGFAHTVDFKDDEVKLNVTIDMDFVDINKMLKDDYIDSNYIISNKLSTAGIKNMYKEKGAICDI